MNRRTHGLTPGKGSKFIALVPEASTVATAQEVTYKSLVRDLTTGHKLG